MRINQEKLTREFANEFIQAYLDMREAQNNLIRLKGMRLKPGDNVLTKAIKDSIIAENNADAMIKSIAIVESSKQYRIDNEE